MISTSKAHRTPFKQVKSQEKTSLRKRCSKNLLATTQRQWMYKEIIAMAIEIVTNGNNLKSLPMLKLHPIQTS